MNKSQKSRKDFLRDLDKKPARIVRKDGWKDARYWLTEKGAAYLAEVDRERATGGKAS